MTEREFCYWLQGWFELGAGPEGMSEDQVRVIREHLELVFEKVTPSKEKQLLSEMKRISQRAVDRGPTRLC